MLKRFFGGVLKHQCIRSDFVLLGNEDDTQQKGSKKHPSRRVHSSHWLTPYVLFNNSNASFTVIFGSASIVMLENFGDPNIPEVRLCVSA